MINQAAGLYQACGFESLEADHEAWTKVESPHCAVRFCCDDPLYSKLRVADFDLVTNLCVQAGEHGRFYQGPKLITTVEFIMNVQLWGTRDLAVERIGGVDRFQLCKDTLVVINVDDHGPHGGYMRKLALICKKTDPLCR